ncbi:uncharacterized protein LOC134214500 [Armigeres subalbatus]|uniref:uncharacterized protein LOC134214500 n=1 Tax=Armigeres subalbatus TaxID=124917 RepID=UPI002ED05C20
MAKPRPCVVPCCQGEKFELVHKFPTDRERAQLWKTILAIPELAPLDVDIIRGRYFVCSRHFRIADYKNKLSRSLNVTANPSLNLRSLCDVEGLHRPIPPMGRPPLEVLGSNVTTVSLEVQSYTPTEEAVESESNEKFMAEYALDPLEVTESEEVEHLAPEVVPHSQMLEIVPMPQTANITAGQKRVLESCMAAGSTPAKIFRFRKKLSQIKLEEATSDSEHVHNVQNDSLILKKVKIMSPQKKILKICSIPGQKKMGVSVETQTDDVQPKVTSDVAVENEVEPEDNEDNDSQGKVTKVLALLECTPENLQTLKKKMSAGAVVFDEKLFKNVEEEESNAMQKPAIDERFFLSLKRTESDEPIWVSYIWLRDHCRCNKCYNHETFQRSLSILDVPDDVSPLSYEIQDGALNVLWKDNHASSYDLDFIFSAQFGLYKETLLQEQSQPALWDRAIISLSPDYCRVSLNELLCDDEIVKKLVNSLFMYGVAFIEKVPANAHSTEMAVRRIFPIHKTLFGEMWTFSDSMDHSDTAYTKDYLGPHTDNTYFSDAAGLQILHCIQFKGTGGQTLLIDGFKAAEQLRLKKPEVFERLCNYPITAEYLEEGKHHTYCAPIIKRNIITGKVEQLRFNIYDRAIMKTIPQEQIPQFYADFKELGAEINDESMAWQFQLTPGTVMIFDNWRVLHGRLAYSGKRVMSGCYVARTDYQSVARTLGVIS